MKVIKHNLFVALVLCVALGFSQTRTQKMSESFNVKSDVIVAINAHESNITVEHWDKNQVSVESVLSIDGVTVEESKEYFDGWTIEALGNSNKVVINSHPNFHNFDFHFDMSGMDFDINIPEMNFDFNFEPVIAYGLKFDSLNLPSPPKIPEIVIKQMNKIVWDQKAYEKDKEKYMAEFEKQQEEWAKELEEKYEPLMKEYEKEMEKWEKEFEEKYEPQMEAYEKEMEKWEKEFEEKYAPQLEAHEKEMEKWEKEFEKNIEPKLKEHEKKVKKMEEKLEAKIEKTKNMKKKITIKIPRGARVDVDTDKGSIILPDNVKTI